MHILSLPLLLSHLPLTLSPSLSSPHSLPALSLYGQDLLGQLLHTIMAFSSVLPATISNISASSFQQAAVLLALFAFIALAARFSITTTARSKQSDVSNGLTTFARFFYASFLKPHNGDGATTGQQAALESFYKAQVVSPLPNLITIKVTWGNLGKVFS